MKIVFVATQIERKKEKKRTGSCLDPKCVDPYHDGLQGDILRSNAASTISEESDSQDGRQEEPCIPSVATVVSDEKGLNKNTDRTRHINR